MGYYLIRFVSGAHTLQEDTTCNRQMILYGYLVVKERYIRFMQEKTNWYWDQKEQQQVIIYSTQNIVHPYLDFVAIKYVNDIPKTSATETTQNRLYKNILYVRLTLIMIISLNKLNI